MPANRTNTNLSPAPPPQSPSQPDYAARWLEACEVLESTTSALEAEYELSYKSAVVYPKRGKRYGAAGAGRDYLDEHIPELVAIAREVRG